MFQHMKLGTKITMGFAVLIVIAGGLGTLAIWNMRTVQTQATDLAEESLPQVAAASVVERQSLLTMYEIRGYGLSEDAKYLERGSEYLKKVNEALQTCVALADRHNLDQLRQNASDAGAKVNEYEQLAQQTATLIAAMNKVREGLDASAKTYMDNCYTYLSNQNKQFEEAATSTDAVPAMRGIYAEAVIVNDIIDLGNAVRLACWRAQAQRDPKVIQDALPKFAEMDKKFEALRSSTTDPADLQLIDATKTAGAAYKTALTQLVDHWTQLQVVGTKRGEAGDAVLALAQKTAQAGIDDTTKSANRAVATLSAASTTMIVGLTIAAALGIALALVITRGITKAINRIIENLESGATQVNEAAGQVASASQQLAEGASEQASSLEETSSALEEMSAMTRTNAENAQKANDLANQAHQAATTGDKTMGRLTSAMTAINDSAAKISKIIKVIEEIAFQTNLLALNAAVEAARAGEHGKGFAVVADEVRNLAMRAAQAAKETTDLIELSTTRATEGSQVADDVGKNLSQIVSDATSVSELIKGIAKASEEQAQGVEQVNTAVSQMDKITQQNAANAEESSSAAQELSAQAQTVKAQVDELITLVRGQSARGGSSGTSSYTPASTGSPRTTTRATRKTPGTSSRTTTSTSRASTSPRASTTGTTTTEDLSQF